MKKSVSICIVLAMVLSLCGIIPTSTQAASGYEYVWFPAPRVYITQLAYESYSHGSQNAIDMAPGGNVFAPFTGKIVYLDSRWGYAVLQSTDKVYYADGTLDYMTVAFMHDENISDLWVGQVISQGTAFYQAGGMGSGNPDAYADHVHLSVHRGLVNGVSSAGKYGAGDVYAFDAFYINSAKTPSIQKEGVMASGNYMTNGAPSNWGGRWKNLDDAVCSHDYSGAVTTQPSCSVDGVRTYTCSKCGDSYTETIPATGEHSYGAWFTGEEPDCLTDGYDKRVCDCGHVETRVVPMLGHSYGTMIIPGTCEDYEKIRYICARCGYAYEEYSGEVWSEIKPSGIPENQLETKTQYRYSDYVVYQTYDSELVSEDLISAEWMEQSTGSAQYVKDWPAGFKTSHELYGTYNNTATTNSETDTTKVTVNSEKIIGYIYWHWCRGTYADGPINRKTSKEQTGEFNTFHAFYSTTSPSGMTTAGDGSVTFPNGDCCRDSHWYYNTPVYAQTYTTYEKLFTYGVWEEWSDWSDTEYTASDVRKVEERTLYRSTNREYADCTWDGGVVTTKPTCTTAGVKTYTCVVCEGTKTESIAATGHDYQDGYCKNCSAEDPEYNFVTAKLQVGTVSGKPGDTVTVPVSISDNPGIAGFTFVFDYDTSAMTLTGISKAEVLQDGTFTPNVAGKTLNWFNAVNVTENGTLFNLTFKLSQSATVGDYSVTVALKDGKSTNFVNENAKAQRVTFGTGKVNVQAPVTLSFIEVVSGPTKVNYYMGDTLNTDGLTLELFYSDGSTKMVTSGFTTSGFDSDTSGEKDVKVTYEGKTAYFEVFVWPAGTCGTSLTWKIDASGTLTISGTGAMTNWTAGNAPWDAYKAEVKKLVISEGTTTIGENAFNGCTAMQSVTIPNSLKSSGLDAFKDCTALSAVHISDIGAWCAISFNRGKSNPVYYAKKVYVNNVLLTTLVIPEGTTSTANYAFIGCADITSVSLPASLKTIGTGSFNGCKGLTTVTIPEGITAIGTDAFYNCINLTKINYNAMSVADLSENNHAFGKVGINGTGITLTIGAKVQKLPAYLFYPNTSAAYAPKLTTVKFEDGSVCNTIGAYAFHNCTAITDVYYCKSQAQWDKISIGSNNEGLTGATLHTIEPKLTGITIAKMPAKTQYTTGESLDSTGLTLKLTYSDGSSKTITTGFTVSGFDSATAGTKTVTVSYEGKTATFTVIVVKPTVDENAPQIAASNEEGLAGETVTVTVTLKNNPGILNAVLTLNFDSGLELVSVEKGEALSNLVLTPPGTMQNGCNFLWDAMDEADTSNGVMLKLTFKIPEGAQTGTSYAVKFSYVDGDIADGDLKPVTVEMIGGTIEVINYRFGDVNNDGRINGTDVTLVRRYIAGGYNVEILTQAADVNKDGRINGTDVTLIRRYIAGGYGVELNP